MKDANKKTNRSWFSWLSTLWDLVTLKNVVRFLAVTNVVALAKTEGLPLCVPESPNGGIDDLSYPGGACVLPYGSYTVLSPKFDNKSKEVSEFFCRLNSEVRHGLTLFHWHPEEATLLACLHHEPSYIRSCFGDGSSHVPVGYCDDLKKGEARCNTTLIFPSAKVRDNPRPSGGKLKLWRLDNYPTDLYGKEPEDAYIRCSYQPY